MTEWAELDKQARREARLTARAARNGFVLHDLAAGDTAGRWLPYDLVPGDHRWLLDDTFCDGYETFASLDEVQEYLARDEKLNGVTAVEEDDEDDEVFSVSMVWRDGRWTPLRSD